MQQAAQYYKSLVEKGYSNYIETYSGKKFYINNPEFCIEDIAHALSNQCRFTGHTKRFYSVAEHSVLVSRIMTFLDLGDPFEGLMHDAHEAYCADLASPWKVELPEYKVFEKKLEIPLRLWAGLPETVSEGCKRADWIALFVEAGELIHSRALDWQVPDMTMWRDAAYVKSCLSETMGWAPEVAKGRFISAYFKGSKAKKLNEIQK